MEATCEAWCEVAVPCSVHYASSEWGPEFTTQTECEDACLDRYEMRMKQYPGVCFEPYLADRECAAELSCEDFKQYENSAFNQPVSVWPPPCYEEQMALESADCY